MAAVGSLDRASSGKHLIFIPILKSQPSLLKRDLETTICLKAVRKTVSSLSFL